MSICALHSDTMKESTKWLAWKKSIKVDVKTIVTLSLNLRHFGLTKFHLKFNFICVASEVLTIQTRFWYDLMRHSSEKHFFLFNLWVYFDLSRYCFVFFHFNSTSITISSSIQNYERSLWRIGTPNQKASALYAHRFLIVW